MLLRKRGDSSEPVYRSDSVYFTIKVHHGGEFLEIPKKIYLGGEVDYIDYIEFSKMSLSTMNEVGKLLGYQNFIGFYYRIPVHEDDKELIFMLTDEDAIELAKYGKYHGEVEVFICQTYSNLLPEEFDNKNNSDSLLNGEVHVEDGSESSDHQSLCDSDYEMSGEDEMIYVKDIDHEAEWDTLIARTEGNETNNLRFESSYVDKELEINESSDDYLSDDLHSLCSDDDENRVKLPKFPRFNRAKDMDDPQFRIGMVFTDANEFKEAVRSHAIKWQRNIKFVKNDKVRVRAKCQEKNCSWVVLASKQRKDTYFQIRTMETTHKCVRLLTRNKYITSKVLSNKYLDDWRINTEWKIEDFREKVRRDLNVDISRNQYYRTKERVWEMLYGRYKDQYTRLYDYCEELRLTNPGSTIVLKTVEDDETGEESFQRLYICFEACKEGFKQGCRPIVGVDGCHLRGTHKGVLLTAVGMDPNNCIFPICYCVAEGEHKSSWTWFLELLIEDLAIYDQEKWTIISDRQKGLLPAVYDLLPRVEHRYCVRHMYNNFKKDHSGFALKDRMWKAARATHLNRFKGEMDSLKEFDESAYRWLAEVNPTHWSKSHFRTWPKCDILLNNLSETFNSVIVDARAKPLLGMVETIRIYLMKRLQSKRDYITKCSGLICPKVQKKLEKVKDECRACIATHAGDGKFEVRDMYDSRYAVDIDNMSCSCRRWDLTGIPCTHGVCAIAWSGRIPEEYVHEYYSKEMHVRAYKHIINPVKGPQYWSQTGKATVSAPGTIRLPGRPKKARKKEVDEHIHSSKGPQKLKKIGQKTLSCKVCGKDGHNSLTCSSKKKQRSENGSTPSTIQVPIINCIGNGTVSMSVDEILDRAKEPHEKRKIKCGVCFKEGHRRNKCDAPTAKIWRNLDFYAPNHQYLLQEESEIHVLAAQNHVVPNVRSTITEANSSQTTTNIGGFSIKTDFVKQGKRCVTLRSLQSVAKSELAKKKVEQQKKL